MKNELSFEITPQIQRYLEEMVDFHNQFLTFGFLKVLPIKSYTGEEKPTPKSILNNDYFWEYLKTKKAIKITEKPLVGKITYTDISPDEDLLFPHTYKVQIISINPLVELLDVIKKQSVKEFYIEVSLGTRWQDMTFRFIDNDHIEISLKGSLLDVFSYKKMGFEDSRRKQPNTQWKFLMYLARPEIGGELSWEKLNSSGITSPKQQVAFKKKKQLLSRTLKQCFQIREDPFYSYRKEKAYRLKINLLDTSGQSVKNIRVINHDDDKDYYNEKTPSVYVKDDWEDD